MQGAQIIVLATPVFLLMIGIEYLVSLRRRKPSYDGADAMSSIGLGIISQIVGVFAKLLTVGVYTALYEHVALFKLSASAVWVWVVALVLYDFFYYWHHRFGHTVALVWAAHVVHHQSERYNLSTALRQTGTGWLVGWVFYLPMAVLGFPPVVFAVVALIDLLYQFWVHTEQVGKLGWFDRWFCSPSNHRVHHAVNDIYLDRNYGGIFMVWDHLFGSFQEERDDEPCIYGTRSPLRSWNPLWANAEVYAALWRDSKRAASWADKLRVWFKPPGWRPPDVAAADPKPAFDLKARERYAPPVSRQRLIASAVLFVIALSITAYFLWTAHQMPMGQQLLFAALPIALLWLVGRLTMARGPERERELA